MHSEKLVRSIGPLRVLVVFALAGLPLIRAASVEGVAHEGAQLPILTFSKPADGPDFTLDGPSGSRV
ncbi:MAG: hypothetical protein HY278_03090, partial [candidate division NC10 bacterium]|nr:hypothetical protein [candidate division NC10 bacterium]